MAKKVDELPVYQRAVAFSVAVAPILNRPGARRDRKLREQEPLVATAEELGKMLGGFIKYLNNCDWKDRGRHGAE